MTCTDSEFACSPAILKSATLTGPQLKPSENCAHSTIGLPLPSRSCGSARVPEHAGLKAQAGRSGVDLDVVDGLAVRAAPWRADGDRHEGKIGQLSGPPSTVIGCTFCAALGVEFPLFPPPPPPPPQPARQIVVAASTVNDQCRIGIFISESRRRPRLAARPQARRPCRRRPACGPPIERQGPAVRSTRVRACAVRGSLTYRSK